MNIIFDTENIDQIKSNNILLELDTFYFTQLDKTTTAYCVVDNIKLTDFSMLDQHQRLHADMIGAYKNKDFKLCQALLDQLIGAFGGEVDSFYTEMQIRVQQLLVEHTPNNWNGVVVRSE